MNAPKNGQPHGDARGNGMVKVYHNNHVNHECWSQMYPFLKDFSQEKWKHEPSSEDYASKIYQLDLVDWTNWIRWLNFDWT